MARMKKSVGQPDSQATGQTQEAGHRPRRGIQAIESGHELLSALAHAGRHMALKDLAGAVGMTPGRAHPYLVSFVRVRLVAQDALTGYYGLGPMAIRLGLVGLQKLAPLRLAREEAQALAHRTECSVALSVWSPLGPTIVRLVDCGLQLPANIRTGTVMSVFGTATGRLFAAHLPRRLIVDLLARESVRRGRASAVPACREGGDDLDALEEELILIRRQGYATTVGSPLPGIISVAAPVFDAVGSLVLGLTLMDLSGQSQAADASIAAARASAHLISTRLASDPAP